MSLFIFKPLFNFEFLECCYNLVFNFLLYQVKIKFLQSYRQKSQMSKQKKLRKIVIDKLYNKNDHPMKQSTRSNAPTQSTPNEPKDFSKAIEKFFEKFQTECAIIYQPVKVKNYKPLKRSLQEELTFLYHNNQKLKYQTQQHISSFSSMHQLRNNTKSITNLHKNTSRLRLPTQSLIQPSKINQNKSIGSQNKIQKIKTEAAITKIKSPSQNKISSKQKTFFNENQSLKASAKSSKIQQLKMYIQKSTINLQKQIDQYMTSSYLTNSKNNGAKNIQKNAPKKLPQKQQKTDRMKRIQSLKNLNENGFRKYSYKRQL